MPPSPPIFFAQRHQTDLRRSTFRGSIPLPPLFFLKPPCLIPGHSGDPLIVQMPRGHLQRWLLACEMVFAVCQRLLHPNFRQCNCYRLFFCPHRNCQPCFIGSGGMCNITPCTCISVPKVNVVFIPMFFWASAKTNKNTVGA